MQQHRYPPRPVFRVGTFASLSVIALKRPAGEQRLLRPYLRKVAEVVRLGEGDRKGQVEVRFRDGVQLWVRKSEMHVLEAVQ